MRAYFLLLKEKAKFFSTCGVSEKDFKNFIHLSGLFLMIRRPSYCWKTWLFAGLYCLWNITCLSFERFGSYNHRYPKTLREFLLLLGGYGTMCTRTWVPLKSEVDTGNFYALLITWIHNSEFFEIVMVLIFPTLMGALWGDFMGGMVLGGLLRLLFLEHAIQCINTVFMISSGRLDIHKQDEEKIQVPTLTVELEKTKFESGIKDERISFLQVKNDTLITESIIKDEKISLLQIKNYTLNNELEKNKFELSNKNKELIIKDEIISCLKTKNVTLITELEKSRLELTDQNEEIIIKKEKIFLLQIENCKLINKLKDKKIKLINQQLKLDIYNKKFYLESFTVFDQERTNSDYFPPYDNGQNPMGS